VFATDGAVANEGQVLERIERERTGARLFAVGIGHGVNAGFLRHLAERGRGTLTRINQPGEVADRMGELLVQLESPVLEDVQVDWPLAAESWPEQLPDLYAGEPVMVRARFDVPVSGLDNDTVRVTGLRDLRFVELEWPMSRLSFATGVARAWAQARIQGLARRGADEMDAQLKRDERLLTALDYGVVSSLTSLAAVDRTPRRSSDAALRRKEVAGPAPVDRAHSFRAMPATDAGSTEAGLRGLSILILVGLLLFNRRMRERSGPGRRDDHAEVRS
jgi:Ca-activated chloride channel family protein